ncbi:tRNA guanosine(34) transglycosylase Tgt [Candidatus Gottesmanbacteria bacterium RIFOXYB1_FULL_47_11]|uniref:Queuine tRNA-ribosyltransferase n=1 Tax=Candidatus Gottesmanbacteria bacterium RIFOXYB1_FULL_47_11 TaxID=1798401 RepID=A0A1F6BFS6_9BACT|nr:MAG: tRNA guanosine(34) transglycosylase Tgt [Candidatus Gottesmanbacteria bacterium RIFOXYB1_FULL_47_11]
MAKFGFKQLHKDKKTRARVGEIMTPHGVIRTPAFVPVGTQGSVKSLTPEELDTIGVQLYFVNTYHMYLRPGIEVVKKAGGLHTFMHWDHPLMTDSGGFQVFSLGRSPVSFPRRRESVLVFEETRIPDQVGNDNKKMVKITDDGVEFQSHWDGSTHLFTPERSMEWQSALGGDIHIAFDDCTPYPVSHEKAQKSMERTHAWAMRSLKAHRQGALYGSIQGSVYEDLRKESARFIANQNFDGIAIGGVSVGESKKEMRNVLEWVVPLLPDDKPRHLLGVGEIDDIFTMIERGVDTFDCVAPTRLARTGSLYVRHGQIDITKSKYAKDLGPVEKSCTCYTCRNFTRAYIHHLFHVRELLAYRLATIHNLHFVHMVVNNIREAICANRFLDCKRQWL